MTPKMFWERLRIWGGAYLLFCLAVVTVGLLNEDKESADARNATAWEKNLREANGPDWQPTKTEEAALRASAKVTAERMGPPPEPSD